MSRIKVDSVMRVAGWQSVINRGSSSVRELSVTVKCVSSDKSLRGPEKGLAKSETCSCSVEIIAREDQS